MGPIGGRDVFGKEGLEQAQGLAELHRPALEVAEDLEQLLGRTLLQLLTHLLGRCATEPAAQAQGGPTGEAQGQ